MPAEWPPFDNGARIPESEQDRGVYPVPKRRKWWWVPWLQDRIYDDLTDPRDRQFNR